MEEPGCHNTSFTIGSSHGNSRATQTQTQTPPGSTLIYRTPSRTVRSNWISYLRTSWRRISRTSKVILGTTLLIGFAQIIVTIAILIIGKNEICDKPLDVYLIVFLVRLGFSLPLTLYQYLRPSGLSGRGNQSMSTTASQETVATPSSTAIPIGTSSTGEDRRDTISTTQSSPSTSSIPNDLENISSINSTTSASDMPVSSSDQVNNIQHTTYQTTLTRSNWLDRFKSLLDLISILWFVVGNYMIFTASEQCHRDAKYLFYTTMAWILLGYFLVLIPLLICVTVVLCLPCLLVALRVLNVDYAMIGANKNEIQAIPVYKYKPPSTDHHCQDSYQISSSATSSSSYLQAISSPLPSLSTSSSTEKKKKGIISHLLSYSSKHRNYSDDDNDDDNDQSNVEEWTMDTIDASCTICLSDYENGDLVCRLRCGHHFHKDCVHEWLSLNYKCPLCQRDFRGNNTRRGNYGNEADHDV